MNIAEFLADMASVYIGENILVIQKMVKQCYKCMCYIQIISCL